MSVTKLMQKSIYKKIRKYIVKNAKRYKRKSRKWGRHYTHAQLQAAIRAAQEEL